MGHADTVIAVKFLQSTTDRPRILLTGGVDCHLRVWHVEPESLQWKAVTAVTAHESSINAIAVVPESNVFATASADGNVKVWNLGEELSVITTIRLKPRYIPLTISLKHKQTIFALGSLILAVGGTSNVIQVYVLHPLNEESEASLHSSLVGHEGWIRSLDFRAEENGDMMLASASQDKYVRLWRFHKGEVKHTSASHSSQMLGASTQSTLTAKVQTVEIPGEKYAITFEALLLGHEDWVYSAVWSPVKDKPQLLTASADTSLSIWEPDPDSGIWVSTARLGEISGQKGATSATGSMGGYWTGLWSPNGDAICSLGKLGSWRFWQYTPSQLYWTPKNGIGGHIGIVADLAWDCQGQYLLSTSSDQTTRLHACYKNGPDESWHEFSRPQIHGYDLNCVASIKPDYFVSGADEKLLRVFQEPRAIAELLQRMCNISPESAKELPEAAGIPVLGLSNKTIGSLDDTDVRPDGASEIEGGGGQNGVHLPKHSLDTSRLPSEDDLAKSTLWPEQEKLYGHGYEISAVAASNDQSMIATACKASSLSHAVIRLYDTTHWHEIKPPLEAHSLTVTRLHFSRDDQFLLSVGRDRQWAVFERTSSQEHSYKLKAANPKGHSRMILDAAWVDKKEPRTFVTAGRDRTVKIWAEEGGHFPCKGSVQFSSPVTAVDTMNQCADGSFCLAVGEEDGRISFLTVSLDSLQVTSSIPIEKSMSPSKAITRLAWRPGLSDGQAKLAVASQDTSLRIFSISQEMRKF